MTDLSAAQPLTNFAALFPGQGSQKIGMLAQLAADHPLVEQTFAQASDVLGYDSWALVQSGEQQQINLTERTQPLLLTASLAIWRLWLQRGGPMPTAVAGHSLGEWSALVAAGVVDFADAVNIVRQRGASMQRAVPVGEGAMAAIIGLEDDKIIAACADAQQSEVVAAVNFNAPGQVVIAGSAAAVERAIVACKEAGAKRALPLPVSAPFHTALMRPAAQELAELVEQTHFKAPKITVIHNVNADSQSDPATIKQLMLEQIYQPVQWVGCVQALAARGITEAIECGPGAVLSGMVKRIDRTIHCATTDQPESFAEALHNLEQSES